tara:strand:+ start:243 stop:938 length:696 start_codon:yes stop_codon:yes gene_type:complete
MASIGYDSYTPNKVLNTIERDIDNLDEHTYVQMCNFLKDTKTKMNIRNEIREYSVGQKVLYNPNNDDVLIWFTIKNDNLNNTYNIFNEQYAFFEVHSSKLFTVGYQVSSRLLYLGKKVKWNIPHSNFNSQSKILTDVKYRRFMETQSFYSKEDEDKVLKMLAPSDMYQELVNKNISFKEKIKELKDVSYKSEAKKMIDMQRTKRCRNSEEYRQIKAEYCALMRQDVNLAFD